MQSRKLISLMLASSIATQSCASFVPEWLNFSTIKTNATEFYNKNENTIKVAGATAGTIAAVSTAAILASKLFAKKQSRFANIFTLNNAAYSVAGIAVLLIGAFGLYKVIGLIKGGKVAPKPEDGPVKTPEELENEKKQQEEQKRQEDKKRQEEIDKLSGSSQSVPSYMPKATGEKELIDGQQRLTVINCYPKEKSVLIATCDEEYTEEKIVPESKNWFGRITPEYTIPSKPTGKFKPEEKDTVELPKDKVNIHEFSRENVEYLLKGEKNSLVFCSKVVASSEKAKDWKYFDKKKLTDLMKSNKTVILGVKSSEGKDLGAKIFKGLKELITGAKAEEGKDFDVLYCGNDFGPKELKAFTAVMEDIISFDKNCFVRNEKGAVVGVSDQAEAIRVSELCVFFENMYKNKVTNKTDSKIFEVVGSIRTKIINFFEARNSEDFNNVKLNLNEAHLLALAMRSDKKSFSDFLADIEKEENKNDSAAIILDAIRAKQNTANASNDVIAANKVVLNAKLEEVYKVAKAKKEERKQIVDRLLA